MAGEAPAPPVGVHPPSEGDLPPKFGADWDGGDAARSLGSGIVNGTSMLVGLPGDLQEWMKSLIPSSQFSPDSTLGRVAQFLKDESAKTANLPAAQVGAGDQPGSYELPSSGQVSNLAKALVGEPYEPQTDFGKLAYTIGQKVPGMPFYALTRGR